ncbi:ABC transporter ATP-binding protein [Rivibacter subsaxonicus]|uniref:ABC-2 type transport system ATP-binding protein n=1 Tax=Rivibacter subsaxonicus TaxID=457575 RepID=A0A4Q7VMW6_9BURK|nr:ABC transporter ATP-binding protein [Rivibacter subsaxonicus]RZT97680.1 ABC-2 type transport system ATP-binding protein [Rivibacter subsaxonicus]
MNVSTTHAPPARGSLASSLHAASPFVPAASVEVKGLHVGYGKRPVIDGLDWQLVPGQVVGLLGRNGAGKTTLLEALLGLRDVDSGSVSLFGQPLAALDDAARARIGFVPQASDLFPWLTGAQLLAYFRSFYPRWNEAKVEALLTRWDIDRNLPIARLSGGQQQRLSIIRALAHEPDLLVLDEPVASLDPVGRRDFLRELVEQVLDRGTTVVFSTHILSDLERVAFNVAFLARGRIALQAPLDELIETTRRLSGPAAEVRALMQAQALQPLAGMPVTGAGERLRLLVRCTADAPAPAPAGAVLVEKVGFEDLYAELTA